MWAAREPKGDLWTLQVSAEASGRSDTEVGPRLRPMTAKKKLESETKSFGNAGLDPSEFAIKKKITMPTQADEPIMNLGWQASRNT